ncbi:MAG: type I 3-dehydroquinate dehydratase [Thermoanaerobaculia bacterium]
MERTLPNPAFIASLAPINFDDAKRLVSRVPGNANVLEYRLDLAAGRISSRALLELDPRCTVVTYRTTREGGKFDGSVEEYRRSVQSAYDAGAAVDVELDSGLLEDSAFLPDRSRVIGSRHADEWPKQGLSRDLAADVAAIKLVRTNVASVPAAAACVAALRELSGSRPIGCFATGRRGSFTRIVGPQFGAGLTYGSVETPTADGQIPLSDLLDVYRIGRTSREGKIFAVYGGDVSSSLSPRIHNTLFARRGLPHLYLPISSSEGPANGRTLLGDLAALEGLGLLPDGLSVTNPFKSAFESIVEAIDEDDAVARTGAANTLVRLEEPGGEPRFLARNTDSDAVLEILSGRGLAGRRTLILGNGGAARAAAHAAGLAGCEVFLTGRDARKVKPVADRFGAAAVPREDVSRLDAELLVNATPLGARDDDPNPFSGELFRRRPAVIDFAYRGSGETPLIRESRERGCDAADGLEILARQAVGQAKLFGVGDVTLEEIDSILRVAR